MFIASFDIGKKNFAFYIEEVNIEELKNINTDIESKYNIDGTPEIEFQKIIDQICLNGKNVLFKNSDLTYNCDKKKYLDPETFHNMTDLLDEYKDLWNICSIFIIEQQMSFGKNRNTMAIKLGQHCYSYFCINYGRFKKVVEFPAYYKTQILGAKKNAIKKGKSIKYKVMDKPSRKKWSVIKAKEILNIRNDYNTLNYINSTKKKDDLADVLCQLQAYKILHINELILY